MLLRDFTPVSEPNGTANLQFANDDLRAVPERHFQTMDSAHKIQKQAELKSQSQDRSATVSMHCPELTF